MYDVTITTAKARAERFAAQFDEPGLAGVARTRKAPVSLADRHKLRLEEFCQQLPADRRDEFKNAVLARLSGFPMMGAVTAAARSALIEMGYSESNLRAFGFIKNYDQGQKLIGGSPAAQKPPLL